MARALAQAPPPAPNRFGLLTQAPDLVAVQGQRLEGGAKFLPYGCDSSGTFDPCDPTIDSPPDNQDAVEADPFFVYTQFKCSTFGMSEEEFLDRARRELEACQSKQAEAEFANGTLAIAQDWPNQFLLKESSDVLTSGADTPTNALACLEQGLAECSCSGRGMIHATPQVVTLWKALNLIERVGQTLVTINDNIVVPGAGYTGDGPYSDAAAGSVWAYATGIVHKHLGPVETIPGSLAEAATRNTNLVEVRAQRPVVLAFDPCCHLAVEINAPACGIGS